MSFAISTFQEKKVEEEILDKIQWMDKIRKVVSFSLLVLSFFAYAYLKKISVPIIPLLLICLIEILVNTPYPFIIKRISKIKILVTLQATLDMILITLFTYYFGGIVFLFSMAWSFMLPLCLEGM